jgi:hypothetical protein
MGWVSLPRERESKKRKRAHGAVDMETGPMASQSQTRPRQCRLPLRPGGPHRRVGRRGSPTAPPRHQPRTRTLTGPDW